VENPHGAGLVSALCFLLVVFAPCAVGLVACGDGSESDDASTIESTLGGKCGNSICQPKRGETCSTCPADSGPCAPACGDGQRNPNLQQLPCRMRCLRWWDRHGWHSTEPPYSLGSWHSERRPAGLTARPRGVASTEHRLRHPGSRSQHSKCHQQLPGGSGCRL